MAFAYLKQNFICAFVFLESLQLLALHTPTALAFSMRSIPSRLSNRLATAVHHGRKGTPRIAATSINTAAFTPLNLHRPNKVSIHNFRLFSTKSPSSPASELQTPLFQSASHLLKGLDTFAVNAKDGHPLSVYGIHSEDPSTIDPSRRPILMLHGRTWSSVPVYHLLGGGSDSDGGDGETNINTNGNGDSSSSMKRSKKSRSLMEAMYDAGLQPYAMDFRGFGGTPMDDTKTVIPNQCVLDVEDVLEFISKRHASVGSKFILPTLLGWSQGALVAQLVAQKPLVQQKIAKLILYGSIYDPHLSYPRVPLFVNETDAGGKGEGDENENEPRRVKNTFNGAIEDFTVEGSIPPDAALEFADSALLTDPYKAQWSYLSQFNNCDPARIHVPTLVVAGDQDPYAPLRVQAELFSNLGRGNDRTWSVISDADHAVHLLDNGRDRFLNIVTSFVENSKKGEKGD